MGAARAVVVGVSLFACGDRAADPETSIPDAMPDMAPTRELVVRDWHHDDMRLFAVKDGDAPWRSIERFTTRIPLESERYGLAVDCEIAPSQYRVEIVYATLADASDYTGLQCRYGLPTSNLMRGTVLGTRSGHVTSMTSAVEEIRVAASGRYELETFVGDGAILVERDGTRATRVGIQAAVDPFLPSWDIDLDEIGRPVTTHSIEVTGDVRAPIQTRTTVRAMGANVALGESEAAWYAFSPSVNPHVSTVTVTSRLFDWLQESTVFLVDGADLTLHMPGLITAPEIGIAAIAPYVRPRIYLRTEAEADVHVFTTTQVEGSETRTWSISIAKGYVGSASELTTIVPDFSELDGFHGRAGFVRGVAATWRLAFAVSSGGYATSRLDCTMLQCPPIELGSPREVGSISGTFVP